MKLRTGFVRRFYVLTACHRDSGWYYTRFEVLKYAGRSRIKKRLSGYDPNSWRKEKKQFPVALIIYGQGIVSKAYSSDSEFARKIIGNSAEFLSVQEKANEKEIRLTFMRRTLYESVVDELSKSSLPPYAVRMCPAANPSAEVFAAAEEFFSRDMRWKNRISGSREADLLNRYLAKQLLLPVLGVILFALVVNFFIGDHLTKTIQRQNYELSIYRENAARRSLEREQQLRLETLGIRESAYPFGFIADRIAAVVPDGIMLSALTIFPVTVKIRENKPVHSARDRISIRGESVLSDSVSLFSDALGSLEFVRQIKLLSLEKDRHGKYLFVMELYL